MRHWYKEKNRAWCGVDLDDPENYNYIGYLQINECGCIKCLEKFIKVKNNRVSTKERKVLAKKRLNVLIYVNNFQELING